MVDAKRKRVEKDKPQRRRGRKDRDEREDRSKRSSSSGSAKTKQQQQQQHSATNKNNNNNASSSTTNHQYHQNKKENHHNPNGVVVSQKSHQSLLIQLTEDAPTWFEFGSNLPGRNSTIHTDPPLQQQQPQQQHAAAAAATVKNSAEMVAYYRSWADQIIRTEMELFVKSQQGKSSSSSSDQQWIQNTMKHGTLKDRIAAMSVVVSTNPIHKFHSIDGLLNMAGCSSSGGAPSGHNNNHIKSAESSSSNAHTNSRVAQMAAEALEELFLHTFLPPNRKLISLDQRPLYRYSSATSTAVVIDNDNSNSNHDGKKQKVPKANATTQQTLSPRILLLWRLEELVKDRYHSFLSHYLERTLRREGLDVSRMAALRTAGNLLRRVPEGEVQLLAMLVNKLGDPSKKVAATAAHELRRLIDQHSNMQAVVAREVQQLAHRPHLSARALYNCITFLNQLRLYKEDAEEEEEAAAQEQEQQNKKKEAATKDKSKKQTPSSTKTTTTSTIQFNSKTLSASLIKTYFQLFEVAVHRTDNKKSGSSSSKNNNDSNNSVAMKGRLLSALLTGVNRAHPYLPEKDQEMEEHIDALYRIVHTAPPSACTQALMLLFQLAVGSSSSPPSQPKTNKNNKNHSSSNSKKSPEKSTDQQKARQDRFYRAMYASMSHQQQQEQSALLSSGKHLTLYCNLLYKAMKHDTEPTRVVAFAKQLLSSTLHSPPPIIAASLFLIHEVAKYHSHHSNNYINNSGVALQDCWEQTVLESRDAMAVWDPTKREPRGALLWRDDEKASVTPQESAKEGSGGGAVPAEVPTRAPLWELSLTAHHFHPSVAKFTSSMGQISYAGDPLRDFGLAPFLNKFAYRNPKSLERLTQQQKQRESVADRKTATKGTSLTATPVNDPSFLQQEQVGEQDEFYHKFFMERARRDKIKGIVRKTADVAPDDEEEDEEEVDRAMDAVETKDMDQDFETLEEGWESDEEEEAFVDSLALSLMEDSMDVPIDLDDEDPDTEDWDDLKGDDDDNDDEMEEEREEGLQDSASDDEFLDEVEKFEDSNDDDDDDGEFVGVEGQDGSSNDSHDDEEDLDEDIDKDSDSENEVAIEDGFDSDSSEERPRKKRNLPTFADASEYEELINTGRELTKGKQKPPTKKPKGKRNKK